MNSYANNSFYTGMHLFSGIMFGGFEYSWMTRGFFYFDVIAFFILSFIPIGYMLALKGMLEVRNEKLWCLGRSYKHMAVDFLFYISTSAAFSILVLIYSKGLTVFDKEMAVPSHTAILIFDLVLYAISMIGYSMLAKGERNHLHDSVSLSAGRVGTGD